MELPSGSLVKDNCPSSYRLAYHPLMNPEILSNVFTNFTIDEWRTLRLVNKTWYDELQPRWMEETAVNITLEKPPLYYDSDTDDVSNSNPQLSDCPHDCMSIDYYLYQLTNPSPGGSLFDGNPIRNIRAFEDGDNDNIISLENSDSAITKFWNVCGQSLKYLHLNGVKFSTRRDVRKLLFELTPNLEQLNIASFACVSDPIYLEPISFRPSAFTQLKLKSVTIGLEEQKFPISWMTFFSHFPNIQKFKLTTHNRQSINIDSDNILKAFDTIRQSMGNQRLNLTHRNLANDAYEPIVNIRWRVDDRFAAKLCDMQLPLSNLKLEWLHINKDALTRVINSHRATLQSLHVSVGGSRSPFLLNFPYEVIPENLTQLILGGRVFPTWEFLKYTPNLEKLGMHMTKSGYGRMIVNRSQVHIPVLTRLTKLSYITMHHVSADTVKFLIEAMPNVTELEMSVDAVGFKQICKGWKLWKWIAVRCVVDDDVFVQHITLLSSYLSKLKIDRYVGPDFGEETIHEGFLKLTNLSYLRTRLSPQVNASSIELLKSRIVDAAFVTYD